MTALTPESFPTLLDVFRRGAYHGVISKPDITQWADDIISAEDEPDYFFIEISLARDKNELLSLLNRSPYKTSVISIRAAFGVAYHLLVAGKISEQKVDSLIFDWEDIDELSQYEANLIYDLDVAYFTDEEAIDQALIRFLKNYQNFTLSNSKEWDAINVDVEKMLHEQEIVYNTDQEKLREEYLISQQVTLKKSTKKGAVTNFSHCNNTMGAWYNSKYIV